MFRPFLDSLRRHGVPASLREYLDLLAGLQAGLSDWTPEGFYHLARATLIKNEAHIDRFDRAFAQFLGQVAAAPADALGKVISYQPGFDAARPFRREVNDLGASATWIMNSGLELSVWGRNLLDDRYLVQIFDSVVQSGAVSGYPNQPRTYGVSARFKW